MTLHANRTDTEFPLELVVDDLFTGGVTGLVPTVAVRLVGTTSPPFYLDWFDQTFKQVGWTLKYAPMFAIEFGIYQRFLDITTLLPVVPLGTYLSAEYRVSSGGVLGEDQDLICVDDLTSQVTFLRMVAKNKLHEASGNPGTLILYADDGVTVHTTWTLLDETGGPVLPAIGTPARRSAGLP